MSNFGKGIYEDVKPVLDRYLNHYVNVFLMVAERELQEVRELFGQAADHCLNLKKPE